MDNAEILRPLLEKGDVKQTMELAEIDHKKLYDVLSEGMNLVTASILADIPSVYKMSLIQKVGSLFSSQEYCDLLNKKMFTLHPTERERLKFQGVAITRDNTLQYCEWFNIFDIAFPWLPLSVFEDFVVYLRDDKKLILDDDTISSVKESFIASKRYSDRELEKLFSSDLFKMPEDIETE